VPWPVLVESVVTAAGVVYHAEIVREKSIQRRLLETCLDVARKAYDNELDARDLLDEAERQIFERLLCQCGDCQRLPLSTCGCGWAESMRAEVREQIARGLDVVAIQNDYRDRFGPAAISVPSDSGLDRALWAVPVALISIALPALFFAVRRFGKASAARGPAPEGPVGDPRPELDARLDEELRQLDE
jgi:cytochrome c-type biogenesis protein CcmH/NrfF